MAATYDPSNPDDVTRVRYHIQDTDTTNARYSDAEINFVIAEEGSWQKAVISLLRADMASAARDPDSVASDWLKVTNRSLVDLRRMIGEKMNALGISRVTSSSVGVYRADSNMDTGLGED